MSYEQVVRDLERWVAEDRVNHEVEILLADGEWTVNVAHDARFSCGHKHPVLATAAKRALQLARMSPEEKRAEPVVDSYAVERRLRRG